jgi:7,8-dihydropterin-6-yl-methyl-4-(beta-D-ribofuranosyl)aminobenzene 5'-phosphate synthase
VGIPVNLDKIETSIIYITFTKHRYAMKRIITSVLLLFVLVISLSGQKFKYLEDKSGLTAITSTNGIENPVTVSVIYDNITKKEGLDSDWGFSLLITGLKSTVLFDTGRKPAIFESNFKKMDLNASKVDFIMLSHEHSDHTGGIQGFLKMKTNIPVIIPESFSDGFKSELLKSGLEPVLVSKPALICENLYSSGEFAGPIPEQALVLNTSKGLVVITGCSHPGIVRMLKEIKSSFNKNVYMVLGGFHLMNKSAEETENIIAEMKALGVVKCGAGHCTGVKQIEMFKESFGPDYFELGVGNSIIIN